jgi:serine/threonine-protein kinase CTR1
MDLPPGAARRTTYSLLSQFPDDAPGPPPANVLQRQSSGSSYGAGSSISASSDYPFHLQAPASAAAAVAPPGSAAAAAPAPGGSSPCKSWAQQAEETYQLQLALALRLCADAACAADPGFLDPGDAGSGRGSGRAFPLAQPAPSAESLSHRFWVSALTTTASFSSYASLANVRNSGFRMLQFGQTIA